MGNPKLAVSHLISGNSWAGAEVQIHKLCRSQENYGEVNSTAVAFNESILHDKPKELRTTVIPANEKSINSLSIVRLISKHYKENRSKIIRSHEFIGNILGVLGKEFSGVPYSVRSGHENPDALVIPSDQEGLPITLLEALALKASIVTRNIRGIPEAPKHNIFGWLLHSRNPESYANAPLPPRRSERDQLKRNSRDLKNVRRRFSFKNNLKHYIALYFVVENSSFTQTSNNNFLGTLNIFSKDKKRSEIFNRLDSAGSLKIIGLKW